MKIGLVLPYNIFLGGGVKECVVALREGIEVRGHQAFILTPQPRDYKDKAPSGILLVGGGVPFRAARTKAQISASVDINSLEKVLDEQRFDILHFHEPWIPMLSRQILSRSNAINIGTFHAAMSERWTSRTVERVITPYTKSILKYLDVMTAVSPTATKYVRTLTNRRVHIIPNGIDLTKYTGNKSDKNKPHRHKTIFYIGRLEKRKGLKYLIQAYGVLKNVHPEFRLVIAGEGPDREKLEEFVKEYKIHDVSFLGYIDEEHKLRLLESSDVFCSPALYGESFGIVLLEAMASGCVTVAGNNVGYEAVLRGRGQISIVNPRDSAEFARRLALLGTDEVLRKVWREWASAEAAKYNYENIINQYVALYSAAYTKNNGSKKA
jgi:phosphatidyl-myo-inositol alpha-mannosyltransferase